MALRNFNQVPLLYRSRGFTRGELIKADPNKLILYKLWGIHKGTLKQYLMLFADVGMPADGAQPLFSPIVLHPDSNLDISFSEGITFERGISWGVSSEPLNFVAGDPNLFLSALYN